MNTRNRTQAVYVISVAAELAGMHPQTLRIYERRGLVNPARTRGGNRRYSDADIETLQRIAQLAEQGMNLEGIRRVMELEYENARLRDELRSARLAAENATLDAERRQRRDLVPLAPDRRRVRGAAAADRRGLTSVTGVPWRRAILAVVAAVLALTGVVVALRADGYPAIDATAPARHALVRRRDATAAPSSPTGSPGRRWRGINLPGEPNESEHRPEREWRCRARPSSATARSIDTAALLLGATAVAECHHRARRRRRRRPGGHRRLRSAGGTRRAAPARRRPGAVRVRRRGRSRSARWSHPTAR